jgi:hypothetical protein
LCKKIQDRKKDGKKTADFEKRQILGVFWKLFPYTRFYSKFPFLPYFLPLNYFLPFFCRLFYLLYFFTSLFLLTSFLKKIINRKKYIKIKMSRNIIFL